MSVSFFLRLFFVYSSFIASSPVPTQLDEENQQEQAKALQTSRSDCSLNGTFEMISESEVRESAIQQQQQQQQQLSQTAKPSGNVVAPFVVHQPGKKSRHILKEGLHSLAVLFVKFVFTNSK